MAIHLIMVIFLEPMMWILPGIIPEFGNDYFVTSRKMLVTIQKDLLVSMRMTTKFTGGDFWRSANR